MNIYRFYYYYDNCSFSILILRVDICSGVRDCYSVLPLFEGLDKVVMGGTASTLTGTIKVS